jgi:osmotically inducible protein OsmC
MVARPNRKPRLTLRTGFARATPQANGPPSRLRVSQRLRSSKIERTQMSNPQRVLYTGKTHTSGGRVGSARSEDGRLDITLSSPGTSGPGTNPEQLFAAGWSACFIGAMGSVAGKLKVTLPPGHYVDAEVDLTLTDGAYALKARLSVSLPGLDPETARAIIDAAHLTCPYSKAVHGNIEVTTNVI